MHDAGKSHAPRGLLRVFTLVIASLAMLLALFGFGASPAAAQDTLVIVNDDGGSNDPNGDGQNDLTQFGRDDSDPDTLLIKWSWDEPSTIQGGNASNACAMFDTDGDGNVNYSFCLEVSYGDQDGDGTDEFFITDSGDGTDSVADFPAWIECSDAKDDRCTQPDRLADPYNGDLLDSSCTIMITATDPFAGDGVETAGTPGGAGDDYPNDLMATCEIATELIPDGGELINVCSYPSAGNDGNNNPFDCVVTPGSWFLVVEKVAPDGTTEAFDFTVSGTTNDNGTTTIVGSGSTDLLPATGTASVSESVPDGWQLDSATCDNGDDPSAVLGAPGQTVTCTFANSLSQGTLTLVKVVDAGADPTPLAADSVTLAASDAAGTEVLSGTTGATTSLSAGTYSLSETLGDAEYELTSIVCDGEDVTAAEAVTITAGVDSTCTFTNTFRAAPALSVDKVFTGIEDNEASDDDADAELGETLNYTITATNGGNVPLTNVVVSDDLTGDSTTCASVPVGGTCVLTASYVVTVDDVAAGEVLNTGAADSDETPEVEDTEDVPVVANPALGFDKSVVSSDADGDGDTELGDTLTYTFVASNTGDVELTGVTISDPLDGLSALSCDPAQPATLAVGASLTCTATYTVDLDDVAAGSVSNTATADSGETDPEDDTEDEPVVANPALGFDKSVALPDGDTEANFGDTLTYTFVATNTGDIALTGVSIADPLDGLSALDCDPAQPADLAVGASLTCTATYTIDVDDVAAGEVINTATAGSDQTGDETDTETVTVVENPSIALAKTGTLDLGADGIANPGDVVSYELTVTNDGDVPLTDVSVSDPLLGGVVCTFDSLAVGAVETCSGTYAIDQHDIDAGTRDNDADASGTSPQGETVTDPADADVVIPQIISLDIDKLTNGADDNTILAGSTVTWTYEVTNTGNSTLDSLVVSDSDPAVTVSCPETTLAPGESTTCTASGTAVAGDYTNTGSADADGPQDQDATDSDDSGYFGADPSFTIDKVTTTASGTGDEEFAVEGDTITWTYTVVNTGNVDLAGVVVTDSVEGAVCTVDVGVGETATCTLDGTAIRGVYTNTGEGDATYTDDLGNSEDLNDTDDSGYTGINGSQPSIQFPERINIEEVGNNGFSTTLNITNESDGLEADTVVITDFNIIVESGKGRRTTTVDVDCTVNGQAAGDLDPPISFTGASADFEIECVTADGSPLRGSHKITFEAEILNRDRVFKTSTSVRF